MCRVAPSLCDELMKGPGPALARACSRARPAAAAPYLAADLAADLGGRPRFLATGVAAAGAVVGVGAAFFSAAAAAAAFLGLSALAALATLAGLSALGALAGLAGLGGLAAFLSAAGFFFAPAALGAASFLAFLAAGAPPPPAGRSRFLGAALVSPAGSVGGTSPAAYGFLVVRHTHEPLELHSSPGRATFSARAPNALAGVHGLARDGAHQRAGKAARGSARERERRAALRAERAALPLGVAHPSSSGGGRPS